MNKNSLLQQKQLKYTTTVSLHSQSDIPSHLERQKTASEQPETCRFFRRLQIDDAIYSGCEKRPRMDAEASESHTHLLTGGVVP